MIFRISLPISKTLMTYNYTATSNDSKCRSNENKTENQIPVNTEETGLKTKQKQHYNHLQEYENYCYKKKPASYYLRSKSYRVRHKPLRLDRFPKNELKKIRCGIFIGHQDHRCAYCPFHGIKHGYTLQPTLNCICRFKSVAPSPLKHDITKYMIMKRHPVFDNKHVYWNTGSKQIDRIINHMCMNSTNKRN